MEDLKRRFLQLRDECTGVSDLIILWYSVNQMGYSDAVVRKAFNTLVSKEEYDSCDKNELIDYLLNYNRKNEY